MTTKSKTPDPADAPADEHEYVTADMMAVALDAIADLTDRVEAIEAGKTAPAETGDPFRDARQAAAARTDPVFLAQVGRGRRRRMSEGERQDEIVQANALAHLHEPAGDGIVTAPITRGAVDAAVPANTDEPGEGAPGDSAGITTDDTAALNPTR